MLDRKTIIILVIAVIFVICCAVVLPIVISKSITGRKTFEQRFGPSAPADQKAVLAQRNDNNKYQILLTTSTSSGSTLAWNQPYYVMFNPTVSSDPTQTVFNTVAEANVYSESDFVATPLNKSYSTISTSAANADYKNITPFVM